MNILITSEKIFLQISKIMQTFRIISRPHRRIRERDQYSEMLPDYQGNFTVASLFNKVSNSTLASNQSFLGSLSSNAVTFKRNVALSVENLRTNFYNTYASKALGDLVNRNFLAAGYCKSSGNVN